MSKKVYALRILVETGDDIEIVESRVRGWGEATFDGFICLELAQTQTSIVDMDTLSHSIASMVKNQEALRVALADTLGVLTKTSRLTQQLIEALLHKAKPDEKEV